MLYLDLPRPKKFGDSRRRHHLYSPEGGAAGAMDCFTPQAGDELARTANRAQPAALLVSTISFLILPAWILMRGSTTL